MRKGTRPMLTDASTPPSPAALAAQVARSCRRRIECLTSADDSQSGLHRVPTATLLPRHRTARPWPLEDSGSSHAHVAAGQLWGAVPRQVCPPLWLRERERGRPGDGPRTRSLRLLACHRKRQRLATPGCCAAVWGHEGQTPPLPQGLSRFICSTASVALAVVFYIDIGQSRPASKAEFPPASYTTTIYLRRRCETCEATGM